MLQGVHERGNAQVLAGEHFAHGGAGEGGYAGIALEEHDQVVIETGEVCGRNQAQAALLGEGEENLVFLEVGGIDNHLDTVLERPLGGAVEGGAGLGDLAALELGGIQEGFGDVLSFGSGDIRGVYLGHDGEQLLGGGGGDAGLLGAAVDDDEVFVTEELGGGLTDDGGIDLAEEGLYNLFLRLGLHDGLLVEEVVQDGTDEFRVLTGCGTVDAGFHHGKVVILCALEFSLGDTVFLETDQFRVEVAETAEDVVFAEGDVAHGALDVFINEVADAEAGAQIRRSGLGGDVLETLAHDHGEDAFHKVLHLADGRGVGNFRHGFAVPDKFDGRGGGLRVREDAYAGLLVVCNVLDGLRKGIFLERDNAEELLDFGFGAVHIHVTDHDDGLVAGVIPGVIEIVEALVFEGFQMLLQADEGALCQIGVLSEVIRKAALHGAPAGIAALTALLDDDTALGIDFLGFVQDEVGIVPENHQAAVHHALTLYGDVVEHVLRLFKAGGSVDVAAELCADGTEIVQDALVREVLGSVEAHVLQEVGQTVLSRLVFLNGTHIGGQIEFRAAFGQFVVTDVIGEPVFHLADSDLVGIGKLGHLGDIGFHLLTGGLLRQGHDSGQGQGGNGKKGFLHIFELKKVFQTQI